MALARPEWHRYGDDFTFVWPDSGVGLAVERIRESSSGEMHAEVTAQTLTGGHLHMARLNLWSTTGRQALVRQLTSTYEGAPWAGIVEQMCAITVREWRRRAPPVNLATYDAPEQAPDLFAGLIFTGENNMVLADGGSGKSLTAMGFVGAAITGAAFVRGLEPAQRCVGGYIDYETNAATAQRRYRAVLRGYGIDQGAAPDLHYLRLWRPITDEMRFVRAEVDRLGITFLVIDSIGPACEDLESSTATVRTMNALGQLEGVTRLLVAHTSKENAARPKGRARAFGFVFFENMSRSVIELRRSEESEPGGIDLSLTQWKVNEGEQQRPLGVRVELEQDAHRRLWAARFRRKDVAEMPDLYERESARDRLWDALVHSAWATVGDLAEASGEKEETVKKRLQRWEKGGRAVRQDEANRGGRGAQTRWSARAQGQP